MLSEKQIIEGFYSRFKQTYRQIKGIGDDAAIIPLNLSRSYTLSKDVLIEDIHFRLSYFAPKRWFMKDNA